MECKKCKITKEIGDYHKFRRVCKKCLNEDNQRRRISKSYNKTYYAKNKDIILSKWKENYEKGSIYTDRKDNAELDNIGITCRDCKIHKEFDLYPRAKSLTGYSYVCYDCKRSNQVKKLEESQNLNQIGSKKIAV